MKDDVVIVGAGQAGLSLSHELAAAGADHVVFEKGRVGETWRGRWDSFCLVIPNWTVQLPGGRYRGDDPDGFMPKKEIVRHLVTYAESFRAPVREGVTVTRLEAAENGSFLLRTSSGDIGAKRVVLASGGYQRAHRPPAAARRDASWPKRSSRRGATCFSHAAAPPGFRGGSKGATASRGSTRRRSSTRPWLINRARRRGSWPIRS